MWPSRDRRSRGWLSALVVALLAGGLSTLSPAGSAAPLPQDADALWSRATTALPAERAGNERLLKPTDYAAFDLDSAGMRGLLLPDAARRDAMRIAVPAPTGQLRHFAVRASAVMVPELARKHPQIATYAGRGIEDPTATIRLDITRLGFHASVRGPAGRNSWYVDPAYIGDDSLHVSYFGADLPAADGYREVERSTPSAGSADVAGVAAVPGGEVSLRTYRLALASTPSYADFWGSANVLAAKVTLVNRVNHLYNDDLGIRLVLSTGTDELNFDSVDEAISGGGPCGGMACYNGDNINRCTSQALNANRLVLGQLVGASNYDVGHLIGASEFGGGVAGFGVVGGNNKGRGCTTLQDPRGDRFAVEYVAHELGHQFGASHTFNGLEGACSGAQRVADASVEPGSASSVMGYAGICSRDDLQPHSDPYFSQRSIAEIDAFVTSTQPVVNEIQTVSLRDFGDFFGESFTLGYDGRTSNPIVFGTNYDEGELPREIEALVGSGTAEVIGWGGSGAITPHGFQVTFSGALAGTDVDSLTVTPASGDVTGFVGETTRGGSPTNGGAVTASGNHSPVVTAPQARSIPLRTPFALTGSATDADGDPLTYSWEQNDPGGPAGQKLLANAKPDGPLFRQFEAYAPVTAEGALESPSPGQNQAGVSPTRVFPDLAQIAGGVTNAATGECPDPTFDNSVRLVECFAEFLPTADYAPPQLHFRLTARDGADSGGGTGSADVTLTLAKDAGPFLVTSQGTGDSVDSGQAGTVTWDVANTATPQLARRVRITLSTNGGKSFPHVLASATPNDGAADVVWPAVSTSTARIRVAAVGNYFFDVNDADFTVVRTETLTAANDAPEPVEVQHSDALPPVTVSASGDVDGSSLSASAAGLPAGASLAVATTSAAGVRPGTRTWTVGGQVAAPPGDYPVVVTVQDGAGEVADTGFLVRVVAEDAVADYTGPTSATTTQTRQLTLAATLAEIADVSPGSITNASVTFRRTSDGSALCMAPVVAGSAASAGTASCSVAVTSSGALGVDVVVGGSYTAPVDHAEVAVTYDGTGPQTRITDGTADGAFVLGRPRRFRFEASAPVATYRCTLDATPVACGTSFAPGLLPAGTHTFTVAATDLDGNADLTPATRTWTRPFGEAALSRDRHWKRHQDGDSFEGSYLEAARKGATLTYELEEATAIALVVAVGKDYGRIDLSIGDRPLRRVDLGGGPRRASYLLIERFAVPRSGQLRIVTVNRNRVRVSGIGAQQH